MTKYRAIKETVDGIKFDSRKEADAYRKLKILYRAGEVRCFKLQPEFKLTAGIKYRADFDVVWKDGRREIVDVKGFQTPVFRLKMKLLKHDYPDVKLVLW